VRVRVRGQVKVKVPSHLVKCRWSSPGRCRSRAWDECQVSWSEVEVRVKRGGRNGCSPSCHGIHVDGDAALHYAVVSAMYTYSSRSGAAVCTPFLGMVLAVSVEDYDSLLLLG